MTRSKPGFRAVGEFIKTRGQTSNVSTREWGQVGGLNAEEGRINWC